MEFKFSLTDYEIVYPKLIIHISTKSELRFELLFEILTNCIISRPYK